VKDSSPNDDVNFTLLLLFVMSHHVIYKKARLHPRASGPRWKAQKNSAILRLDSNSQKQCGGFSELWSRFFIVYVFSP